jgi:poly-beta-1,6-N-acetyl-D-glucosamine synthase
VKVVALVPAHNEETDIGATVRALAAQEIRPRIIVIADNCTDATVERAYETGADLVYEPVNSRRKPGALNIGFDLAYGADFIVTVDADTVLPPNAVADWLQEYRRNLGLGGSFAKVTVRLPERGRLARFLARLQRFDFAHWVDGTINRKHRHTTCIGGQGAMFRKTALDAVAARDDRRGPWSYVSVTEDFELTYRLREAGWMTTMSADVRAYTGAMPTFRALWAQRRKWTSGGIADLRRFGFNRLTRADWAWQAFHSLVVLSRAAMVFGFTLIALGIGHFNLLWLAPTPIFLALNARHASRIPNADKWDIVLALTILPNELWEWLRTAWYLVSWVRAVTRSERDLWSLQATAERG